MIPASEFQQRRRQLMRMAGDTAAVVVAAAPERWRNADSPWPYRQDSDFHYLTGFPEPDAVLALLPGRRAGEVILFCREHDATRERWDGPRVGSGGAVARYGVDDAFPIDDIDDILPGMLEGRARLYCNFGREPDFDARLLAWLRRLRSLRGGGVVPKEFVVLGHLLHDLRLYKSRNELRLMQRAADVATTAHIAALGVARPGAAEYEVEAELLRTVRAHGAVAPYPATVAAGRNACIMHYHANRGQLQRGDLLLIDAGAEVECYASDLTRTVPVGGRFSRHQRALYDVVLAAQDAAIAALRPGAAFDAAHAAALATVADGLAALGIVRGTAADALATGQVARFYPHKTCHWLGLDVHDVGDYRVDGESRQLEAGMVVAVEPGLYFAPDDTHVAPEWRGLALRIEDDVAIEAAGPHVLTAALPRAADELERLVAAR